METRLGCDQYGLPRSIKTPVIATIGEFAGVRGSDPSQRIWKYRASRTTGCGSEST